jgi:hypothetical protein
VDIASDGTVYASGTSTALFEADPNSPVTIPMIGVFTIVTNGPERGKVRTMSIYKDRVPFLKFIHQLPGMTKT